jgi:hypothetical protein
VDALFVREEPMFNARVIGLVGYNDSVYPVGRNADASWIAINWQTTRGWVFANFVVWDKALNLMSLTLLSDTALTPDAATQASITQNATLTLVVSTTASPEPTITATPTSRPTQTPRPSATSTTLPTVTIAAIAPTAQAIPTSAGIPSAALPPGTLIGIGVVAIGGVLGGVFYLQRRISASRELKRYQNGFVFSVCPVCREGHVQLDEVVRETLGIKQVKRTVRCNVCLSVLREVKPGAWRYTIDSYVNPDMAEQYAQKTLTDLELAEFQDRTLRVEKVDPVLVDLPDPDWLIDESSDPETQDNV